MKPIDCEHPEPSRMLQIRDDGSTFTECLECGTIVEHSGKPKSHVEMILYWLRLNPGKWFSASDFQKDPYYIGYEATARISDLMRLHPDKVETKREGRFRLIKLHENSHQERLI